MLDSFFFFKVEGRLLLDLLGRRCCCCFSRPVEAAEAENFAFGEFEEDEDEVAAAGVVQPPFLKRSGRLSVVEAIETIDVEAVPAAPPPPLPPPRSGGGGKAKE